MRPSGVCARADLVRALANGDPALADALAGLLGFEASEGSIESARLQATGTVTISSLATLRVTVQPDIQVRPLVDTPFWRLEAYEPVPEEPGDERRPVPVKPIGWHDRPQHPPAIRLLAPWRELQMRLRAALAEPREGAEVDLDAVVQRLSRGRLLDRLPRERHRRWGPRLQLVVDRSERLVPYWTDQDQVRGELARLFTAQDLEQAVFHEGLTEPRILTGAPAPGVYRPPPGGIVLVLGDLACLTGRASHEDNPWLDLGRRVAQAGARPVALVPCPVARCPAVLRRHWQLIPWERPRGRAVTDSGALRKRAERLLRLVSPAVRIEPGLLRAVRLSLGALEADAGTESDVWQHPAVASTHSDAATLDPKRARELRAAFAAEPIARQRMVLALLRTWRGHLPEEIWFEEILNLAPVSREALPDAEDLEDARRFFAYLCERFESNADIPCDSSARAWIGRMCGRADSLWTDEVVGTRLLRVDWSLHRHVPGYRPPVAMDPALVREPGHPERRCELRQRGGELVLSPVREGASADAPEPGSYLGTLRTGNRLVQVVELLSTIGDRNAFWKSGQPPPWADDWGTDAYGHWVTFGVEDERGQKVTQRMRWIAPGTFLMGSLQGELERYSDEGPQHQVTIDRGFWLFDTACTQALWQAVMGEHRSRFGGAERPVENVSWNDCQHFIRRLNERLPGLDLTLPSEAQWEYACRAGTTTPFSFGEDITPEQVNYDGNDPYAGGKKGLYRGETVPVASLPPNPWGLYEMHGNVWEWTRDHWNGSYEGAPADGSVWEDRGTGSVRVIRGGSWSSNARYVRAASRSQIPPDYRHDSLGFRCARVQDTGPGRQGAEPAAPASGRQAERRPARVQPSGAEERGPLIERMLKPIQRLWSRSGEPGPVPQHRVAAERTARRNAGLGGASGTAARGTLGPTVAAGTHPDAFPRGAREGGERAVLLRLDTGAPEAAAPIPQAPAFRVRTDRERLTFRRATKPAWASAIGRDRYGLWTEIAPDPARGEPVTQRLRWIPPGRFRMGSPESEPGRWGDEGPQHTVIISHGYWLFETPCTQALWEAVMGDNPSRFKSPERPVEQVSWDDVQGFLGQIGERIPGLGLVLPSEAQWEYACRAGTETTLYSGDLAILGENNAPALDPIAWYGGNSGVDFDLDDGHDSSGWPEKQYSHQRAGTRPVGRKQPNPWGLYDTLGNVWEWTQDHWHGDYEDAPADGSAWEDSALAGAKRVIRGGSWGNLARNVRAASRDQDPPGLRGDGLGFRCARDQA